MEEDFGLGFNIDLSSLERSLDQVQKLIDGAFSGKTISNFDNKIIALNDRIQSLIGSATKYNSTLGQILDNQYKLSTAANQAAAAIERQTKAQIAAYDNSKYADGFGFDIPSMEDNRNALRKAAQRRAAAMTVLINGGQDSADIDALNKKFKANTQEIDRTGEEMQRASRVWDDMVFGATKATAATKSWGAGVFDSAIKWTAVGTAIGVVYKTFEFLQNSLEEGLQTIGEYQQQMVQLSSVLSVEKYAGISGAQNENGPILNAAMQLAAKYGDNINDVTQNLMLWYKATGDLSSSIALTNESMKFQIATGTDLEDTYRTLTALSTQLGGTTLATWDKSKFSLQDTHKILGMIYDAAAVAGAGMRDVSSSGKQMGVGLDNAAGILLHSLDQDAEALKNLGLNVSQIIALNQSLITAMGNTGSEADNVAERMARLVAGFSSLSLNSKATQLAQNIGMPAFNELQKILSAQDTEGEKLKNIVTWYDQLDNKQKNQFAYIVASQRGYQTMGNLIQGFLTNYQRILKAEQDKNAFDQAAQQMNDTFLQQVKQLQGLWQGVVTIVGRELIPVLENALKITSGMITALSTVFMAGAQGISHEHDITNALENAKIFSPTNNPAYPGGQAMFGSLAHQEGRDLSAGKDIETQTRDALAHWLSGQVQNLINDLPFNDSKDIGALQHSKFYDEDALKNLTATQILYAAEKFHLSGSKTGKSLLEQVSTPYQYAQLAALSPVSMGGLSYIQSHINDLTDLNVFVKGLLVPPGGDGNGLGIGTPKIPGMKGLQSPGQMANTDLQDKTNLFHTYVSAVQDAISADSAHISILERQQQLFGPTATGLNSIVNIYKQENSALAGMKPNLEHFQRIFQNQANNAQAHLKTAKPNTEAFKQWSDVLDRARTSLSEVNKQLTENTNKQQENHLAVLEQINTVAQDYYNKLIKVQDRNVSTADKNFSAGRGSIQQLVQAYENLAAAGKHAIGDMVPGTTTYKDALQEMSDKGQEALDSLRQKWDEYTKSIEQAMLEFQSRGIESAFGMLEKVSSPDEKSDLTYYKEIIKLQQEQNQLQLEYNDNLKKAGNDEYLKGLAKDLLDMGEATISLDAVTAQYARQVEEIQNSGIFKAFSDALSTVGSTAGQDLADQIFGNNSIRDQLSGYDAVISKIQEEKQWYDMYYSTVKNKSAEEQANEKLQIYMLDQQIKKQQDLKKAEEDRLNHPGLLKKFEETFTKDLVNDLVKQMEQNIENGILKAFMPKQDSAMIQAMQNHVKGMQANFQVPVKSFNDMLTKVFDPDIKNYFTNSTKMFKDDVENKLKPAFDQFHVDITDPSTGLVHALQQFHDDITSGGSGVPSGFGATGYGSGTYTFSDSTLSPTMSDNQVISYIANQNQLSQTSKALGLGNIAPDVAIAAALSGGDLSDFGGGMSTGGSFLNGLGSGGLNMLLSAGGGGSFPGLIGGGLALASAYGASDHKGNFALGSLAGVVGAGALVSMLTAGTIVGGGGIMGGLGLLAGAGPAGWAALLGAMLIGGSLGGMIGPHYNTSKNPDMFANDGYAQGIANAQGVAYTSANGWVNEDPALSQALGGQTELEYLSNFVKAHPNGQGLTGSGLALWNQINSLTVGGTALGLNAVPNGQVALSTAPNNEAPNIPGTQTDWQSMLNQIDSTTNALQQFEDTLNQGSDQLIVGFNQFGSGVGFFPYAWNIPGYYPPANPSQTPVGGPSTGGPTTTTPTPTAGPGSPIDRGGYQRPGGGLGGRTNQLESAYTYSPSYTGGGEPAPLVVNTSVNLDGRTVAQNTQAYQLQAQRRGYTRIS